MLYYLLTAAYVLSCLLLLMVILLQQGKGGDMASAFGGGSSQTAFGARGDGSRACDNSDRAGRTASWIAASRDATSGNTAGTGAASATIEVIDNLQS